MTFDATLPFLLAVQFKALVILAFAALLARVLRSGSAGVRHAVWCVAIVLVFLLPALAQWGPAIRVHAPSLAIFSAAVESSTNGLSATSVTSAGIRTAASMLSSGDGVNASRTGVAPIRVDRLLLCVWFAGTLLLLARLAFQLVHASRVVRRAIHVDDGSRAALARVSALLGVRRPVRLMRSSAVRVPCTAGVWRPVVLLPDLPLTPQQLESVLLHELTHVRRRDYASCILAEAAAALYWPNPLIWVARQRLNTEQEHACDEAVVRAGVTRIDYAQHLLDMARAATTPASVLAFVREATLTTRVRAVLRHSAAGAPSRTAAFSALLALCMGAVPLALLRPGAASPIPVVTPPLRADEPVAGTASQSPRALAIAADKGPIAAAEAAGASFAWVDVSSNDDASNDDARAYARLNPAAQISSEFTISADGIHYVWLRVRAADREDASLALVIDGATAVTDRVARRRISNDEWTWIRFPRNDAQDALHLSRGTHTLALAASEGNLRIDGILLTSAADYRPLGAPPIPPPAAPVAVWMEGEDAVVSGPFVEAHDHRAAGARFLKVSTERSSREAPPSDGAASFRFSVPQAGTYVVWARTRIDDNDEDSYWVRANGGPWIKWNDIEQDNDWTWSEVHDSDRARALARFDLNAGDNTLEFAYRERGTRLDRVLITNDPALRPRGRGITDQP